MELVQNFRHLRAWRSIVWRLWLKHTHTHTAMMVRCWCFVSKYHVHCDWIRKISYSENISHSQRNQSTPTITFATCRATEKKKERQRIKCKCEESTFFESGVCSCRGIIIWIPLNFVVVFVAAAAAAAAMPWARFEDKMEIREKDSKRPSAQNVKKHLTRKISDGISSSERSLTEQKKTRSLCSNIANAIHWNIHHLITH